MKCSLLLDDYAIQVPMFARDTVGRRPVHRGWGTRNRCFFVNLTFFAELTPTFLYNEGPFNFQADIYAHSQADAARHDGKRTTPTQDTVGPGKKIRGTPPHQFRK